MTGPPRDGKSLIACLPAVRGRLVGDAPLKRHTWFRAGGPAEVLFTPEDEADLAGFLERIARDIPVCVIGLGSNLLIRDGGIPGVVIRLGRGFSKIEVVPENRVRAGCAAPDVKVAHAALKAGLGGLTFLRGIPGTIGGALAMNGGAYGAQTADVLIEASALDRRGKKHVLSNSDMGFGYRQCAVPGDWIFTQALFQGSPGDPKVIAEDMKAISDAREASQPVRERTGGSTFKNPEHAKAWELIDWAGCRGLEIGQARVSDKHCNFLINRGGASARDLEDLGEMVRARVKQELGVELEWEIHRIGVDAPKLED